MNDDQLEEEEINFYLYKTDDKETIRKKILIRLNEAGPYANLYTRDQIYSAIDEAMGLLFLYESRRDSEGRLDIGYLSSQVAKVLEKYDETLNISPYSFMG